MCGNFKVQNLKLSSFHDPKDARALIIKSKIPWCFIFKVHKVQLEDLALKVDEVNLGMKGHQGQQGTGEQTVFPGYRGLRALKGT